MEYSEHKAIVEALTEQLHTHEIKDKDIKHLEWMYERMKYVHNENENCDYMIRFRKILETLRQPAVSPRLFAFAEWAAGNYIRLHGTWVHKFADQRKKKTI